MLFSSKRRDIKENERKDRVENESRNCRKLIFTPADSLDRLRAVNSDLTPASSILNEAVSIEHHSPFFFVFWSRIHYWTINPVTMHLGSLGLLALGATVVSAFRDTSPFFMASTSEYVPSPVSKLIANPASDGQKDHWYERG